MMAASPWWYFNCLVVYCKTRRWITPDLTVFFKKPGTVYELGGVLTDGQHKYPEDFGD